LLKILSAETEMFWVWCVWYGITGGYSQ